MHYTCTVFCSYIIAEDNTERIGRSIGHLVALLSYRLYPREKLCVVHTNEFLTFIFGNNLVGHNLVARLVVLECHIGTGGVEMSCKKRFGKNHCNRLSAIAVVCLNSNIFNLRAHTQGCVRRQCPRCCCPSYEVWSSPPCHFGLRIQHSKLSNSSGILYIPVTARLVKLVGAKACTCSGRIWLNGIALIEQPLVV